MTNNNIGFGFGATGDKVSSKRVDASNRKNNEATKFACYAREYMRESDPFATVSEIRIAYEKAVAEGRI